MIQQHAHRHMGPLGGQHHHRADHIQRSHRLMHLGVHDDHRHIQLFRRVDDRPGALQVGRVEGTDGVIVFLRQGENFIQTD